MSSIEPVSGAFAQTLHGDGWAFDLLDVAGRGGMGRVYRARCRSLDRIVALKRAHADVAGSEDRLRRESIVLAGLIHPNIVGIHHVETSSVGLTLVLEWIEGSTLTELLGSPTAENALVDVARALAHAHQQGWVHRDLKPSNILVDRSGRAVLVDWGLAARVDDAPTGQLFDTLTQTGTSVGTPGYMAPEQACGGECRPTNDVWSFGALLHQHITGEPPDTSRLLAGSATIPDHPLAPLMAACLQADPQRRPADGAALVARLQDGLVRAPARRLSLPLILGLVVAGTAAAAFALAPLPVEPIVAPRTAEAFTSLAWAAYRDHRTRDAEAWAAALDGVPTPDGPGRRGLDWMPPQPDGATFIDVGACETPSFTPDGARLLCADEGLRLIDTHSGATLWSRPDPLLDARLEPDGIIARRTEDHVFVLTLDGEVWGSLVSDPATRIAFEHGRMLAWTGSHITRPARQRRIQTTWNELPIRTQPVWDSVRGAWLATTFDELVWIDPDSLAPTTIALLDEDDPVVTVDVHGDHFRLLGMRGALTIVDRTGRVLIRHQLGAERPLRGAVLDGDHVLTSRESGLDLWDVATGGHYGQLTTRSPTAMALQEEAVLWWADGQLHRLPMPERTRAWSIPSLASGAWTAEGLVVSGADGLRRLWDPDDRTHAMPRQPLPIRNRPVHGVAPWRDGWALAASDDGLLFASSDGLDVLDDSTSYRDIVDLPGGALVAVPYGAGPLLIGRDGHIDHTFQTQEYLNSVSTNAARTQVGFTSLAGPLFTLAVGDANGRFEHRGRHPGAKFLVPVASEETLWWLVDSEGVWRVDTSKGGFEPAPLFDTPHPVTAVGSWRDRCFTGDRAGRIEVRDCDTGGLEASMLAHTERVSEILVQESTGDLVSLSWDGKARWWPNPTPVRVDPGPPPDL